MLHAHFYVKQKKLFLILTMLFSLLFIALIALGSHWLSLKTQPENNLASQHFYLHLRQRLDKLAVWRCIFGTWRVKK